MWLQVFVYNMMKFLFVRRLIDRLKTFRLRKYYSSHCCRLYNTPQMLIFMADGRMHHGGLTDRLCGIISAYRYCKKHNIDFKINFVSPYKLSDIFKPASYNWLILPADISYDKKNSEPIYLSAYSSDYNKTKLYFEKKLGRIGKKQIHLYTNARCFRKEEFPILFFELFKPVPALQNMINENRNLLPPHYISLTFRFQQLLGDFREDGFPVLKSEREKKSLIESCLKCVTNLHEKTRGVILVTSDSQSFLDVVSKLDYVHVTKGKIRHMDFSKDKDVDIAVDMKSYVDFFLLAYADRLYVCVKSPLYRTGFPLGASYLYGKPVEIINDL